MSSGGVARGDILLVDVPYLDATQRVRRPALVVCDPTQMLDLIIAGISSRIRQPLPATHYVIDRAHPDWIPSGLRLDSVVRCDRLFTIELHSIHRVLGGLSPATMLEVEQRLKLGLGIR